MWQSFAAEFAGKALRDFRAIFGVTGLVIAWLTAMTGTTLLMPSWGWLLIAAVAFLWMAIRAEWIGFKDRASVISADMKLVDVIKRILGSDDIFLEGNHVKIEEAFRSLRELAHLKTIII